MLIGVLCYSCSTPAPKDAPSIQEKPAEPAATVQEEPQNPQPEPEPETKPQPEPEPEPEPEIKPQPQPDPPQEPEAAPPQEEYEVSEEIYNQTYDEIEKLIHELNGVISRRQYDRWLNYLSKKYKKTFNSPEVLNAINDFPQLKDNGIVLKNIKDYFDWVVVPSRSKAVLGDMIFTGEDTVIAYSSYNGQKAKLYELERINGKWKITVW